MLTGIVSGDDIGILVLDYSYNNDIDPIKDGTQFGYEDKPVTEETPKPNSTSTDTPNITSTQILGSHYTETPY